MPMWTMQPLRDLPTLLHYFFVAHVGSFVGRPGRREKGKKKGVPLVICQSVQSFFFRKLLASPKKINLPHDIVHSDFLSNRISSVNETKMLNRNELRYRLETPHRNHLLHPGRLTWNLQITHLERKMIFQTSMIMFHVNLQGCI